MMMWILLIIASLIVYLITGTRTKKRNLIAENATLRFENEILRECTKETIVEKVVSQTVFVEKVKEVPVEKKVEIIVDRSNGAKAEGKAKSKVKPETTQRPKPKVTKSKEEAKAKANVQEVDSNPPSILYVAADGSVHEKCSDAPSHNVKDVTGRKSIREMKSTTLPSTSFMKKLNVEFEGEVDETTPISGTAYIVPNSEIETIVDDQPKFMHFEWNEGVNLIFAQIVHQYEGVSECKIKNYSVTTFLQDDVLDSLDEGSYVFIIVDFIEGQRVVNFAKEISYLEYESEELEDDMNEDAV